MGNICTLNSFNTKHNMVFLRLPNHQRCWEGACGWCGQLGEMSCVACELPSESSEVSGKHQVALKPHNGGSCGLIPPVDRRNHSDSHCLLDRTSSPQWVESLPDLLNHLHQVCVCVLVKMLNSCMPLQSRERETYTERSRRRPGMERGISCIPILLSPAASQTHRQLAEMSSIHYSYLVAAAPQAHPSPFPTHVGVSAAPAQP